MYAYTKMGTYLHVHINIFILLSSKVSIFSFVLNKVTQSFVIFIHVFSPQEQSSVFDIRSYGSDIVHTPSKKTPQGIVSGNPLFFLVIYNFTIECVFKELVKNKEPFEICRMFAASLQLVSL